MGMSRKIQKLRMLREGERRSPRISALDVCKAQQRLNNAVVVAQQQQSNFTSNSRKKATLKHKKELDNAVDLVEGDSESKGPAKKKRKLKPLQDVASSTPFNSPKDSKASGAQDDKQQSHDQPFQRDQLSSMLCASWLPEKRILELIIDILQRKDSNEIFAEPVDPDEVEDYYEIIKEPMDFGTMRAKLHEGMYKSLAQFEHDVFLITGNAMDFNTSGTIYFRQARAIDDLAKKVFYALKTDPENFEMEFSGARRRSGRRPLQTEARNAICNSSNKPATNSRSYSRKPHPSSKHMDSSTNGLLVLRKSRLNSGCSVAATTWSDSGDHGLLFDGTSEADRRSSYKPQMSFLSEKHSFPSTSSIDSKLLVHVNQQDIGYCKSLMLFAKDLGPTAQMIAKRKIMQCSTGTADFWSAGPASGASNYPNYTALTSGQWNFPTQETRSTVSSNKSSWNNKMEIGFSDKGKGAWPCNTAHGTSVPSHDNDGDRICVFDMKNGSSTADIMSVGRIGKFQQNLENVGIGFFTSATSDARDVNLLFSELTSTDERSTSLKPDKTMTNNESPSSELAPRNLWPNSSQQKLHENLNLSPSSCTGIFTHDQRVDYTDHLNSPLARSHHPISADKGTNQGLKSGEDWKPVTNFTFDLPFLKNKLDDKNPMKQDCFNGRQSVISNWNAVVERPFYSSMNNLDNKQANLILRL